MCGAKNASRKSAPVGIANNVRTPSKVWRCAELASTERVHSIHMTISDKAHMKHKANVRGDASSPKYRVHIDSEKNGYLIGSSSMS